jgi:hypothetical protein
MMLELALLWLACAARVPARSLALIAVGASAYEHFRNSLQGHHVR